MKCLDIQSIIKNYESYVINWIRPLAKKQPTGSTLACALIRAPSAKLQALKLQAASVKPQATSVKLQAASDKLTNLEPFIKFQATSIGCLD